MDVDQGHRYRHPVERLARRRRELAVLDDRHVGARPTHVERDEVRLADPRREVACPDEPCSRPGELEVDGARDRSLDGRDAAVGAHDHGSPGEPRRTEVRLQQTQIGGDGRADIAVDHGGARALVLAEQARQVRGNRDVRIGATLADDLGDPPFVAWVAEGPEEADRERADPPRECSVDGFDHVALVERRDLTPSVVGRFRHLVDVIGRHERRRMPCGRDIGHRAAEGASDLVGVWRKTTAPSARGLIGAPRTSSVQGMR